jgi:TRAP-type uncharacterized transport system substrate-binding protein
VGFDYRRYYAGASLSRAITKIARGAPDAAYDGMPGQHCTFGTFHGINLRWEISVDIKFIFRGLILGALIASAMPNGSANAQSTDGTTPPPIPRPPRKASPPGVPGAAVVESLNAWTVGLAGGQLEGAPIRFATEIARVVDNGENLHVLPIVTRGPAENVEDLLYLKGIDAAVINADALEEFRSLVPNVQQKITYILNLFPSELHIFVRPEITSLNDLKGKKVNFNTPGTAAAYSGPLIFQRLKIDVQKTFVPHQTALEEMRAGKNDMAAVVFITSKPIDAFARATWEPGFKFLPVPFDDSGFYLPSTLTSNDYPRLIAPGQDIRTIAVPTILAAYNWPRDSDRYRRVARLTTYLFDRLAKLQGPGFHPAWRDVNLNAKVPGLIRFPAAQDWLDQRAAAKSSGGSGNASSPSAVSERRVGETPR